MKTREELSMMTSEQLQAFIEELRNKKRDIALLASDAGSPQGRRILAFWQRELGELREAYNGIAARNKPAEDVRLDLVMLQVRERFMLENIQRMESSIISLQGIDKQLEMCHAVLEDKQKADSLSR